jgi:hypothetical protein
MDHFSNLIRALDVDPEASGKEDLASLRRVVFQEPPTAAEKLQSEFREIIDRAQRKSSDTDPVRALRP